MSKRLTNTRIMRLLKGDVFIRRASNGWVRRQTVQTNIDGEDHEWVEVTVYEDDLCSEQPSAVSLAKLLWETFPDQFQNRRRGGIRMDIRAGGARDDEDDRW